LCSFRQPLPRSHCKEKSGIPEDISVSSIRKVLPDANARYSAISRTYKYYLSLAKDPFLNSSSWFLHGYIDIDAMNQACSTLITYSDFTSFSKLHSGSKTNICKIYDARWEKENNSLVSKEYGKGNCWHHG
jgi:tRNA pseudouridine38-40 synthase